MFGEAIDIFRSHGQDQIVTRLSNHLEEIPAAGEKEHVESSALQTAPESPSCEESEAAESDAAEQVSRVGLLVAASATAALSIFCLVKANS